jgi:hypothetical protein
MIQVQSDRLKFSTSGAVRHCVRCGATYLVGIEFGERLKLHTENLEPPA